MEGRNDNRPIFRTLGEMFFYCLEAHKNRVFQYIDDKNETTTYSEILQWSIRTAIKLKKKGITQDDIISSCTHNQKHSPVPFIATQFLGAISNNFDPELSHLDTIHLLKLIQPKILFVAEESLEFMETCLQKANVNTELVLFGYSEKYSQFSEYLEPSEDEANFRIERIQDSTDTAAIFFSSGTTGLPKGVCLNHRTLLKVAYENVSYGKEDNNQTTFLSYPTIYWISSAFFLIKAIINGYSAVIRINFDPEYTWKLIEKYKVTAMFLAPYHAIDFLNKRPENVDTSSLEFFLTGSCAVPEKLTEGLWKAFPDAKILIGYGQTETAGVIAGFDATDPKEYELQLRKPKSCGKVRKGMKWKIVDINTEKAVGPNQEGELRVKYDGYIMNGYYKTDSSSAFDSDGYFKTGDIAYFDEDECLYIAGRIKEIFKYRGWHILPALLEDILMSHPAVKDAAIVGVPHEIDGDHPMAVVVLFDGYDDTCANEIEAFVTERVSDSQKLRAGVKIIDSIPKTSTGKVRRRDLKNIILNDIKPLTN